MAPTTCPKCGRQVAANIHVPLSQSSGLSIRRCTCGQELVYKSAGFDAREAERQERIREQQLKDYLENYTSDKTGIPYILFAICLALLSLGGAVYLMVVNLQNRAIMSGILLFLGSLVLWVVMVFVYLGEHISYRKDEVPDEASLRVQRVRVKKTRFIGVMIGLAMSALSISIAWYGGIYSLMTKVGEIFTNIVEYVELFIWIHFGV
ncbi:hypothetical protein LJC59_07440 [Desulfovibrio sp. OttesenSCG-928-A18]|nr:hypothetical protein [Desulfovibrio sp. OttesenSCG-928-A18]